MGSALFSGLSVFRKAFAVFQIRHFADRDFCEFSIFDLSIHGSSNDRVRHRERTQVATFYGFERSRQQPGERRGRVSYLAEFGCPKPRATQRAVAIRHTPFDRIHAHDSWVPNKNR
jgi:hypothetical protein